MPLLDKARNWNKLRKARRNKPKIYIFPEKFAYIPIPKCATRSMYDLLGSWAKEQYNRDFDDFGRHAPHEQLLETCKTSYTFALVRHPIERLYSAYKNKVLSGERSAKKNIFDKHGIERDIGFDEFAEKVCSIPDELADRHFRSQTWYISKQGTLFPADIIKLENIPQEWVRIENRTGLILPSRLNATRKVELPTLDSGLEHRIKNRYHSDFSMLGY